MDSLSKEYLPGADTFTADCLEVWEGYMSEVERRQTSLNPQRAQRGRHESLLADWYTANTASAEFFTTEMKARYTSMRVRVNRSVARGLTAAPFSARFTTMAEKFELCDDKWFKFWAPRQQQLPDRLVDSIANALFVDTASAAAAFEVEADTKQPSIRILSDIVAFLGTNLTFAMELAHHLGNGENLNAKIGVARSDFAITSSEAKNVGRAGAAFLIAEFAAGADAHPIHKDTFVSTAEAVFESHRIVAHLDIDSVPLGRVHILLGSDRKLKFGVVQPIYLPGGIFWERQMEGLTFDLSKTLPFADRLENALRMACYMKEVVLPDCYRLCGSLSSSTVDATAELLPVLPTKIPPQRAPGAITPLAKRRRK
ncbi:hypothetical protein HDU87_001429 [Geranomyces variabilis]|uniref:Uncharacterized protein n=1 Tax=Geranomyces variabilis TaxID=109894 RepID=A0AAD5TBI2_9FUNG|nr:hypothetical protein HDU87_001429 [Geranomyces variabilis]